MAPTDCLIDQGDIARDGAEVLLLATRPADARAAAEDALARFERKEYAIGIRRAREFLAVMPGSDRRSCRPLPRTMLRARADGGDRMSATEPAIGA